MPRTYTPTGRPRGYRVTPSRKSWKEYPEEFIHILLNLSNPPPGREEYMLLPRTISPGAMRAKYTRFLGSVRYRLSELQGESEYMKLYSLNQSNQWQEHHILWQILGASTVIQCSFAKANYTDQGLYDVNTGERHHALVFTHSYGRIGDFGFPEPKMETEARAALQLMEKKPQQSLDDILNYSK